MSNDPLDYLNDFLTGGRKRPEPDVAEKGGRVRGHRGDDGVYYVRLDDVCDLLNINNVLPGIEQKFRKSI